MAITGLKTWTTSDALSASNLNADKTILEAKFNGNINTADLADSAVTNAKLANVHYEIVLGIDFKGTQLNNVNTNDYRMIGGIPYDADGGTAYTIVGISHVFSQDAAGSGATVAPVYTLQVGNITDGFTTVKTGLTPSLTDSATAETGFTAGYTLNASRPMFFRLDCTTAGAGYVDGDCWAICIKLKRDNGLRS